MGNLPKCAHQIKMKKMGVPKQKKTMGNIHLFEVNFWRPSFAYPQSVVITLLLVVSSDSENRVDRIMPHCLECLLFLIGYFLMKLCFDGFLFDEAFFLILSCFLELICFVMMGSFLMKLFFNCNFLDGLLAGSFCKCEADDCIKPILFCGILRQT